jgi:hypothetical protein
VRLTQLRRRLAYVLFGALPATFCAWVGDAFSVFVTLPAAPWDRLVFVNRSVGALVGTVGLWAAVAVRIPVQNLWMRVLIACSLIIGVLTMLPYSLSIVYGSIVDAAQPHGFQNLGGVLLLFWFWVGPLGVACHFNFLAVYRGFKTRLGQSLTDVQTDGEPGRHQ